MTVLATAGKVAGSYLGALAAGKAPELSLRLGVLLNTRRLTELVVLQAGYNTEIFTAPLFAAFVVMALLTTAMTGPVYGLIDRYTARRSADAPTADYPVLRSRSPAGWRSRQPRTATSSCTGRPVHRYAASR